MANLLGAARALPRDARLLLLSLGLGSFPIGLLMVFFPLYLHDLGLHAVLIGSVFTIAGVGSSLFLMAIGPLADRVGRRYFLIFGTVLPAFGFIIFTLTTAMPWLIVASMLGGVGFSGGLGGGLVTATFNPTLAGTVEPRLRTVVMSWAEGAWGISLGIGALLAGVPSLLAHARILPLLAADRGLFIVCLVATLAATALLLLVHESHTAPAAASAPGTKGALWDARAALPVILKLAVFFVLQGAGLGLVVQLLPLWFALRFQTSAAAIAPWFAAAQMIGLVAIPFVPALARRLGTARVIVLVASLSTLLLVGVPLSPVLPLAGIFYLARSALVTMQWPAQQSFVMGAVDPRVRGTAQSVVLGCWSMANALLPTLAGYLLDRRLLMWPLVLGIACYAGAATWFWLALRGTALPEEAALAAETAAAHLALDDVSVAR